MPSRSGSARRHRVLAAAGLVVALATSACPGTERPPGPSPDGPAAAGTIRLGYPEEPPTLNPVSDPSPASRDILRPVLPSFFLATPDLRYVPYLLAEEPSVTSEGDRLEVRFRIHEQATWSDGTPVTVSDVAFTWRVMTDPSLDVANPFGFHRVVGVVEEDDPKRGRLLLEGPWPAWRDLFSAGRYVLPAHAASSPADVAGWDRGPPVTAGPFRLGEWVPGRSVRLDADPRFWGAEPSVEGIEVTFVPDPTTAIQLLQQARLDAVAPMAGVSWGGRLDALSEVEVSRATGPDLISLVMNTERIPDVVLRRRIADSVDRGRFLEVVLREEAEPADGVLPPELPGAEPAWAAYGTRAPPPAGLSREIQLVHQRGELMDLLARYVQAELERAGIDAELVPLESDVFHGRFLAGREFDLALVETRSGPAADLWRWVEVPGAAEPITGLADQNLARLVGEGVEGNEEALQEAQVGLAEQVPVQPLFRPVVTMGWRAGVSGLAANPTVEGPLWNASAWGRAG
jgi:ABC-type transport system substrate-binding protein